MHPLRRRASLADGHGQVVSQRQRQYAEPREEWREYECGAARSTGLSSLAWCRFTRGYVTRYVERVVLELARSKARCAVFPCGRLPRQRAGGVSTSRSMPSRSAILNAWSPLREPMRRRTLLTSCLSTALVLPVQATQPVKQRTDNSRLAWTKDANDLKFEVIADRLRNVDADEAIAEMARAMRVQMGTEGPCPSGMLPTSTVLAEWLDRCPDKTFAAANERLVTLLGGDWQWCAIVIADDDLELMARKLDGDIPCEGCNCGGERLRNAFGHWFVHNTWREKTGPHPLQPLVGAWLE